MTIEELHDRLFEVLCLVDDICKEQNIRYFLDSGTEIGAVREHDFIPWDDDMDLKVLAEDYPAFKAAMKEALPDYMEVVEPSAFAPHFFDFTVRVIDKRQPLRVEKEEDAFYGNLQNRVGTDVFLFVKAPSSPWKQKLLTFRVKVIYGLGMAHRYVIKDDTYTPLQKTQVFVLSRLGKLFSAETICKMWFKTVMRYQNDSTATCRFAANYQTKNLRFFDGALFEQTATAPIRGRDFPIPAGFDRELTEQYGDYRKPPKNPDAYIHHLDENN